jgi:5-methylthioadenosine/S-adenosylhomocysteine deaminase
MAGMRGISDDQELHHWLEKIFAAEANLTPTDIERASEQGMRESLRFGTTTVADMYFAPAAVAKAAERTGVRAIIGSTFLKGHPLAAHDLALPHDQNRISFAFAPHAIYTTDEQLLKDIRAEATKTKRRILIHVCETRQERADWKAKHGMLPVEWLEKIGFLGPDVLAAHCAWITKHELDILAKHHVNVVHCPQSNMKLAGGGVMPLREMRERHITPALGTDGVASNNALDMFREMHVCALLHKHHYWDPTVTSAQMILDMATVDGATALNMPDIGSIEKGKIADLITLDLTDINLQPHSKETILSHAVYAAQGLNVQDVIVDGKVLLQNKQFIGDAP